MTPEELGALPLALSGDFRSIEPHLSALDKHLTVRTFIDGYSFGELDQKIWLALGINAPAAASVRKGRLVNLKRWFLYIEQSHPEIQSEIKAKKDAKAAKTVAASKAGGNYNLALQDVEKGVVTRFLPEPS